MAVIPIGEQDRRELKQQISRRVLNSGEERFLQNKFNCGHASVLPIAFLDNDVSFTNICFPIMTGNTHLGRMFSLFLK